MGLFTAERARSFERKLNDLCASRDWPRRGTPLPACALIVELGRSDPATWGTANLCGRCGDTCCPQRQVQDRRVLA